MAGIHPMKIVLILTIILVFDGVLAQSSATTGMQKLLSICSFLQRNK